MMMTVSACLWLGLFPLLQTGTYAHITKDKWIFMLILTGVSLVCFLIDFLRAPLRRSLSSGKAPSGSFPLIPVILAGCLTFWILLSWILSPLSHTGMLVGLTSRREGLISQLCYLGLFFMFAFSRVDKKPVLISAAAGVAAFYIIVRFQQAGTNPLGLYPAGRVWSPGTEFQGTIGNVDMGTGYLLILAALFLTGIVNLAKRLLGTIIRRKGTSPSRSHPERGKGSVLPRLGIPLIIYLIALILTVYLIFSFEVQFGKITLAALLFWTVVSLVPKKWRIPLAILLIVLALAAVWFWPGQGGGLWELHEMMHGRVQLSFGSNRIGVWYYSLQLAMERLLVGGGPDSFEIRFNAFLKEHGYSLPGSQGDLALPTYFDNPHNEYIAHLVNHGLPAMLLFIALIVAVLFYRQKKKASGIPEALPDMSCPARGELSPFKAAVFCYAVQAFFSFSIAILAPMFWVVLGSAVSSRCSASPAGKTERPASPARPGRPDPGRSPSGKR